MITVGARYETRQPTRPTGAQKYTTVAANETEHSERDTQDIWQWLSKHYNPRSASREEIKAIAKQLYNAGEISTTEHSVLSLDERQQPFGKTTLTADPDTVAVDWIDEYQARIDFQREAKRSATIEERLRAVLQRLVSGPLKVFA